MCEDRHLVAVEWHTCLLPGEAGEPGALRMDDHRAARHEQLRPRRRDPDLPFRYQQEFHPHKVRGPLLVIDIGFGEGRFADGTPERRALAPVEEPFRPELEKDRLAEGSVFVGVRVVRMLEVRRHADADRELEEAVTDRLDLLAAFLDERLAVPTVERLARLLFDGPLDVDPVPVQAEREQHGATEHPLRASDHVDHRVRHDGADVPRPARVRRGRGGHRPPPATPPGQPDKTPPRPPPPPPPCPLCRPLPPSPPASIAPTPRT